MSRIIAGTCRGQRIDTPRTDRTRPTTDRVREAVFSAIGSWAATGATMTGLRMLDLYAGSGAMGLEAASRGAEAVLCVEADRATARLISRNADRLGLNVTVRAGRVDEVLCQSPPWPADVAWFDPPYQIPHEVIEAEIARLVERNWLASDGLVIVERSSRSAAMTWPPEWDHWQREYGETTIYYAQPSRE